MTHIDQGLGDPGIYIAPHSMEEREEQENAERGRDSAQSAPLFKQLIPQILSNSDSPHCEIANGFCKAQESRVNFLARSIRNAIMLRKLLALEL